jgi:uncharacterized membrane protein
MLKALWGRPLSLILVKLIIVKKQLLLLLSCAAMGFAANAQTATATPAASVETAKPALSKEEKAKQKAQQEQDLADAIKGAGLSDDQAKSVHEALDAANKENKALSTDASLTEEQKAAAKKQISDRKNNRLKEIMGSETYKKWNDIRKEQKARTSAGQ